MAITHLNPEPLHRNPAFSQGTLIPAGSNILIVGGQNGVGPDGQVVSDQPGAQSEQAMRNVLAVLADAGADQGHVAKLTIYLAEGVDVTEAYTAAMPVWGNQPTAVTVLIVRSLGRPECLVEIDAIAAVPA